MRPSSRKLCFRGLCVGQFLSWLRRDRSVSGSLAVRPLAAKIHTQDDGAGLAVPVVDTPTPVAEYGAEYVPIWWPLTGTINTQCIHPGDATSVGSRWNQGAVYSAEPILADPCRMAGCSDTRPVCLVRESDVLSHGRSGRMNRKREVIGGQVLPLSAVNTHNTLYDHHRSARSGHLRVTGMALAVGPGQGYESVRDFPMSRGGECPWIQSISTPDNKGLKDFWFGLSHVQTGYARNPVLLHNYEMSYN